MSSLRVEVTAEHCAKAGSWPMPASPADYDSEWANPVELAIVEATGVAVDVDGDEEGWHATIGTTESSTLVVDLPEIVSERLNPYYAHHGLVMEPFGFDIELDDWLVALVAKAASVEEQGDAVLRADGLA